MLKDRILAVAAILTNMLMTWLPPPILPVANPPPPPPPPPHPIIQTMRSLKLGKLLLALAPTATLGALLSDKFQSPAGACDQLIISGLMAAFMLLWNGILLRDHAVFPRLGSILEALGMSTLFLIFVFGLVATFLSGGFSLACWLSGVFCLIPFACAAVAPQPAAPAA